MEIIAIDKQTIQSKKKYYVYTNQNYYSCIFLESFEDMYFEDGKFIKEIFYYFDDFREYNDYDETYVGPVKLLCANNFVLYEEANQIRENTIKK